MKKTFNLISIAVLGMALFLSCDKEHDPAQYFKPQLTPEIESLSAAAFSWACDDLNAQTLTLTGKGLTPKTVTVVSENDESAFNIACNGDLIHFSPKEPNIDPDNKIEETVIISVEGSEPYKVTLSQNRMDKPMILSLDQGELKWDYDEVAAKTINVTGLNLDSGVTLTSNATSSAFDFAFSNYVITVTPKAVNESTEDAKEETVTIAVEGGNSMTFMVKQARAPKPVGVLYESVFDVAGTATTVVFNANMTPYEIDGVTWKMAWACFTAQYKLSGKNSHILASVRKGQAGPAIIESGNLITSESKVTSFTVSLARRNDNNGWCKVEYSADGEKWVSAGPDFQALLSSSKVQDYTYELDIEETKVFQVRVTFHFNGEVQTAHQFLNFDGIKVMGY